MSGQENDQIIEMLDSIEAAIGEDNWGPIPVTAPPPSLGPTAPPAIRDPSVRPAPALPAIRAEMRRYQDSPPRSTASVLVRGTANDVLSRFKWGLDK
jgi:hypothetical protein